MNDRQVETKFTSHSASDPCVSDGAASFIAGRWPVAIVLLLAALPYLGMLRNDFVYTYDDKALILDSAYVHSAQHLREVLTSTLFSNQGAPGGPPYYRPIAKLGFLLCYQIFGPNALGFHLISLVLNVAVASILFIFAERLLGSRLAAFAVAVLFALLPVHVEAVAWISAVTDIEVTLFYILTFWFFLRIATPGGTRIWTVAAMTGSFILALLSKEPAVTLPLLATFYEHFCRSDRGQTTFQQKMLRYAPLWILTLVYVMLRVRLMGSFVHVKRMNPISTLDTLLSALALIGQYVGELLWPFHLSAFHLFHASHSFLELPVLAGLLTLGSCAALVYALWIRERILAFGVVWLFVTLAPVLNARWMSAYVLGERYLYLPSVGFCLVAGWAWAELWQYSQSRNLRMKTLVLGAACTLAALFALRISLRVIDWRDDVTLFARALLETPSDYRLHDALGAALAIRGELAGAEREWLEALRLEPHSLEPLASLGALYAQEGQFEKALPILESALEQNPTSADVHLNLGAAYAETGKMDRAEQHFRAAVTLSPINFNSHNVLGKLYFDSHRLPEAEQQFRQSLQCEPNIAAYDYLGYIYTQQGDSLRAEESFKAALAIQGTDSHAHFHLGLLYAADGKTAPATEELQKALATDPHNPEIMGALEKLRR